MADKLQGIWAFTSSSLNYINSGNTHTEEWAVNFTSNGEKFDRFQIIIADSNADSTVKLAYRYAVGGEYIWAYPIGANTYLTIEITSKYDEVENADTLVQALTARSESFTPTDADIIVPMTSAKGVLLKTQNKFCENDILVTPELEELTVTENGEYTPSKVGFGKVTVNVAASGGVDLDSYLTRTIEEFKTDVAAVIGPYQFASFANLKTVDLPNATAYTVGGSEFAKCYKLETVNIPKMQKLGLRAFEECTALVSIDLPEVSTMGNYLFYRCTALKSARLPIATTLSSYCFQNCKELEYVYLPEAKILSSQVFNGCYNLPYADFPKLTRIDASAFVNCYRFTTLILRSATVCSLSNSNAFSSSPFSNSDPATNIIGGKLLVPSALVESYKTATNWSVIWGYGTNQFLALEDYTVDGTITGEIDWDKLNGGTTE